MGSVFWAFLSVELGIACVQHWHVRQGVDAQSMTRERVRTPHESHRAKVLPGRRLNARPKLVGLIPAIIFACRFWSKMAVCSLNLLTSKWSVFAHGRKKPSSRDFTVLKRMVHPFHSAETTDVPECIFWTELKVSQNSANRIDGFLHIFDVFPVMIRKDTLECGAEIACERTDFEYVKRILPAPPPSPPPKQEWG